MFTKYIITATRLFDKYIWSVHGSRGFQNNEIDLFFENGMLFSKRAKGYFIYL